MSWLSKLMPCAHPHRRAAAKRGVPEGLWEKCDSCGAVLYRRRAGGKPARSARSATTTWRSARVSAWLAFLDEGSVQEIGAELGPVDALQFKDQKKYADRIKSSQKATGERDALIAMQGKLKGRDDLRQRLRIPLHGRLDGFGGRRTLRPGGRTRAGNRLPAGVLLRHRRRAHAGRPVLADADGQDLGRAGPPARRRACRTSRC